MIPCKLVLARLILVLTYLPLSSFLGSRGLAGAGSVEATTQRVTPTLFWVNFYGLSSTLNGKPVPPGTRITAYNPQGIECGEFVVGTAGQYGVMPVYGDDPTTTEHEGALAGDLLSFRINGLPALAFGPDEPRWTTTADLKHVELAADQASGTATPIPATSVALTPATLPSASPTPISVASATVAAPTPVPAQTATSTGKTPEPVLSITTLPVGSQPSPTPVQSVTTPLMGTPNPFPTLQSSPSPDTPALLGLAAATPTASSVPRGPSVTSPLVAPTSPPGSQPRLPVAAQATPTAASQESEKGDESSGNSTVVALGMLIVFVLIGVFLLIRRRSL